MPRIAPAGSISCWIAPLKAGDPQAATPLWNQYFSWLVDLARSRLRSCSRAATDEEDIALSAFDSFFRRAAAGQFPKLDDRDDLWQVLFMITARKVAASARRERAEKRGGGHVLQASALTPDDDSDENVLARIAGAEPSPEFVAMITEDYERLLAQLTDELRRIAVAKMEGFTNKELADRLGKSVKSVERKLKMIRDTWNAHEVHHGSEAEPRQ